MFDTLLDPGRWCTATSAAHSSKSAWSICKIALTKVTASLLSTRDSSPSYRVSDRRPVMWRSSPRKQFRSAALCNEPHITGIGNKTGLFDANIWITCCSGRRQILKTSCWISGPTSTTIARIPHGEEERPIRRCHDQSKISALKFTRHSSLTDAI
jgi:hypothetical protein